MKTDDRNSSIELLRILSIAFVLLGHIFGHGAHGEVPNSNFIFAFGISINVFMLISGYYGIRLRLKSLLNMAGMVMFYSICSTGINYLLMGGEICMERLVDYSLFLITIIIGLPLATCF